MNVLIPLQKEEFQVAEILRVGTRLLRADSWWTTCCQAWLIWLMCSNQKHVLSVCFKDIRVLILNFISKKQKACVWEILGDVQNIHSWVDPKNLIYTEIKKSIEIIQFYTDHTHMVHKPVYVQIWCLYKYPYTYCIYFYNTLQRANHTFE